VHRHEDRHHIQNHASSQVAVRLCHEIVDIPWRLMRTP